MKRKTEVFIEQKFELGGEEALAVTVHGKKALLSRTNQSLEIVTKSGQRWYLSQVDGQSFVWFKHQKLWIRLQKAWSVLRGEAWWEKIEIQSPG